MFSEELGSLQTPILDQGTTDTSTQFYEDDKFPLSIHLPYSKHDGVTNRVLKEYTIYLLIQMALITSWFPLLYVTVF